MTRRLNGLAVFLCLYALVALWFNVTVFAVMMVASMGCLIQAERLRRKHIQAGRDSVWRRRIEHGRPLLGHDWRDVEVDVAPCMDCGRWWTLDGLALTGGACGRCVRSKISGGR